MPSKAAVSSSSSTTFCSLGNPMGARDLHTLHQILWYTGAHNIYPDLYVNKCERDVPACNDKESLQKTLLTAEGLK